MDWRQLIIDYPFLGVLVVLPMVGMGALIKIGLVFSTSDVEPSEEDED